MRRPRLKDLSAPIIVGVDPARSQHSLRYTARVAAPGTYVWEPAILQMASNPAAGVVVPATTITIAGATP